MLFAVTLLDRPGADALRHATSAAHRAFVSTHAARMLLGGPLTDESGTRNIGSLIILEAETEADARALLTEEPYCKAGVFEQVILRPFRPVIHNPELTQRDAP